MKRIDSSYKLIEVLDHMGGSADTVVNVVAFLPLSQTQEIRRGKVNMNEVSQSVKAY